MKFWVVILLIALAFVTGFILFALQESMGLNIFQEGVSASSGISARGVG